MPPSFISQKQITPVNLMFPAHAATVIQAGYQHVPRHAHLSLGLGIAIDTTGGRVCPARLTCKSSSILTGI
jgi:hypothetical protein